MKLITIKGQEPKNKNCVFYWLWLGRFDFIYLLQIRTEHKVETSNAIYHLCQNAPKAKTWDQTFSTFDLKASHPVVILGSCDAVPWPSPHNLDQSPAVSSVLLNLLAGVKCLRHKVALELTAGWVKTYQCHISYQFKDWF